MIDDRPASFTPTAPVRIASVVGVTGGGAAGLKTVTLQWVDVSHSNGVATRTERGAARVVAAAFAGQVIRPGDVVAATFRGGKWWVLQTYCRGLGFSPFLPSPCSPFDCVEGVYFPQPSCDDNAPAYYFNLARLCCPGQTATTYVTATEEEDLFTSESFACEGETLYWKLVTGATPSLTLLVASDDSTPAVGTIRYVMDRPWCCKCANLMRLSCPVSACSDLLPREVCLRPSMVFDGCALCDETPFSLAITLEDTLSGCTDCGVGTPAGEYIADFTGGGPATGGIYSHVCEWRVLVSDPAVPCTDELAIWLYTLVSTGLTYWGMWWFSSVASGTNFLGGADFTDCGTSFDILLGEIPLGCSGYGYPSINVRPLT